MVGVGGSNAGSTIERRSWSALLVDEDNSASQALCLGLRRFGYEVSLSADYAQAAVIAEHEQPYLIVTELRVGGQWAFDKLDELKRRSPNSRVAIVTRYPSVTTAVRSVRLGFSGYAVKPIEARLLLDLIDDDLITDTMPLQPTWPSLDRTIWEYINQVFVSAGSMSEAARRLRLDRRSLRRMLAKYPPHI